jgi:diguanylate cyclase (GGDEF)-like protein
MWPRHVPEHQSQAPRPALAPSTKVWVLNFSLAVLGFLLWMRLAPVTPAPRNLLASWPILGFAYFLADRFHARFEVNGQSHLVNTADALLVIGLSYLSPVELLLSWALGDIVGTLIWHRKTLQKGAFNVVNRVLECAIAVSVYSFVVGASTPVSGWGSIAAFAAVLAAGVVSYLAVSAAISITSGQRAASLSDFAVQVTILAFNVLFGLIAVNVIWVNARGAWMLIAGLVLASAGYNSYVKTRQRLVRLTSMEQFASRLAGETDASVVVTRSLSNAAELLHAAEVRLVRNLSDGLRVQRLGEDGKLITDIYNSDDPRPAFGALLSGSHSVLVPEGDQRPTHRAIVDALGWTDLVAAPLPVEGELAGLLLAGNRLAEHSTFDANDLRLLETFALSTSVALRVCDLVDELKAQAQEKEHQSRHDALTKLPNRMVADERLRQVLAGATPESMVGVMFIDLDRFKDVNDALGHHVGDELLREIANRLRHCVGRRGTVARLGGDEFAIIVPGVADVDELTVLATELRAAIAEPVAIDRLSLNPMASVGIALAPHDGTDARSLFRRADVAMYAAKNRRTGFEYYDPRFDKSSTRTLSLTTDLRSALVNEQLLLHYQPQASLDGRLVGVEALARWPHPRYGSVPPDEFIAVAEQHGLIHLITRWAISTALADLREMREHLPDLRVSVNMSARDLMDLNFPNDVDRMLRASGLPASALTLELTETQMLSDRRRSIEMLGRLRALGIRLAVDDFGTGQSSLAYLKSLPIHEVKIDRSFVLSMAANNDDAVIVRSIIDMAHNLGLEAVAEGVEDSDAWRMLEDRGCDLAQGYFMTPGLPARELLEWLEVHQDGVYPTIAASAPETAPRASVVRLVPKAS